MDILQAILLGIIEGLTEFLPVSSTGHLILVTELLGIPQTDVVKSFNIAIQMGAIFAVVALYFKSFFDFELLKKLFIAFLPTGMLGLLLYPVIKGYLLGNPTIVVGALFAGGIALIVFEYFYRASEVQSGVSDITYGQAIVVGLFQSVAMIPGVSRSAATIVGGLLAGMPRAVIVEFSFLLAVPTMLAATGYDILKTAGLFSAADALVLFVGFTISFAVALLSMRALVGFVKSHSFVPFGIYRVALAVIFFIVVL
jgi:undecaprenyl-diphosphatase